MARNYRPNRKWNPIKRIFINKGCLSEKVVALDKGIGNANSLTMMKERDEEHKEYITSMVTTKIIK